MNSVLIVGIDGLQPIQVTPEKMPHLYRFSSEGVTFARHHSVFPTVTRVNAATITTGCYPGRHGIAANNFMIRDYDPNNIIPALKTELTAVKQKIGNILLVPNLAKILGDAGLEWFSLCTGGTGNAFVQNPYPIGDLHPDAGIGITLHTEFSFPTTLTSEMTNRFGPWPSVSNPNELCGNYSIRVLLEHVLTERNSCVTLLWFSDPDGSQHLGGVGSEIAERSVKILDDNFGKILDWLDLSGRDANTDVLVVSDHGYSTSIEPIDIDNLLLKNYFPPISETGGVAAGHNGGSIMFYVKDQNIKTSERLANWLMAQPWCGSILTSEKIGKLPGTLPAELVGCDGQRAPDMAMSFAWNSSPNDAGYPGQTFTVDKQSGLGQHGSLSKHDLHNVLFARGPSFKSGIVSEIASGNTDIAPTILQILGLPGADSMDGRVLRESLIGPTPALANTSTRTYQTERPISGGTYQQELVITTVESTSYTDQGFATRGV